MCIASVYMYILFAIIIGFAVVYYIYDRKTLREFEALEYLLNLYIKRFGGQTFDVDGMQYIVTGNHDGGE